MNLILDTNNLYLSIQRTYGRLLDYRRFVDSIPEKVDRRIAYVSAYGDCKSFVKMLEQLEFEVRVKGRPNESGVNFNVELALDIAGKTDTLIVGSSDACLLPAIRFGNPFELIIYGCSIPRCFKGLESVECREITKELLYAGKNAVTA